MAKDNPRLVRGVVKPANPDGFLELIEAANDAAYAGYTLVGVVNVGRAAIGGVLVRMPSAKPPSGSII